MTVNEKERLMGATCGVRIRRRRQELGMTQLELAERTCMLQVNRTAYTVGGECLEYSESSYVSGRYTLTMTMKR